ncbi:MAG: hypothetical protein HQ483_03545 [Rhodospirillales bacterium]|nr:hypothetical protein [Rhodospirillales bacterium]
MKLAKTIRLDVSDSQIFPLAAEPGEWAIAGTFAYVDKDVAALGGKDAIAFKSGWLGLGSFGRATLVQVAVIPDTEYELCVRQLAEHLYSAFGAPDMLAALDAARHELDDMAALCAHPSATLLAIGRQAQVDGIAEQVRIIPQPDADHHARIWEIEETDETEEIQ